MQVKRCTQCGGLAVLVNVAKLRGQIGLGYGWVHSTRYGRVKRKRHAAVVDGA